MQAPTGGTTHHRVNAAERAIQTFKEAFIAAPIAAVGQAHPTSAGHAKLNARVKSRSHKISVRDIEWTV